MENSSEIIMVEDGANCTLTVHIVKSKSNHNYIETQVLITK